MVQLTWNSPITVGIQQVGRVSAYVTISHDFAYKYNSTRLARSAFSHISIRERTDISDSSSASTSTNRNALDMFDIDVGTSAANETTITTFWNDLLRGNTCTTDGSGFVEDSDALFGVDSVQAGHDVEFKQTPADAFDRCFARGILGGTYNISTFGDTINKSFERRKFFQGEHAWNVSVQKADCTVAQQFIDDINNSAVESGVGVGAGMEPSGNVIAGLLNGLLDGSMNASIMDSSGANSRFKDLSQNEYNSLSDKNILQAGDQIYCALVILGNSSTTPGHLQLVDLSGQIQTSDPDNCLIPYYNGTASKNLDLSTVTDINSSLIANIIGQSDNADNVANQSTKAMVWRVRIALE